MQIIITETNELTDLDLQVLRALVGDPVATIEVAVAEEEKPAPRKRAAAKKPAPEPEEDEDGDEEEEAEEEEKPAPRKRAAAKKTAAKKPAPADDEDEDGEEDEDSLAAQAVEKATALIASGKAAKVKKALAAHGVTRVTELKDEDDLAAFIEALED